MIPSLDPEPLYSRLEKKKQHYRLLCQRLEQQQQHHKQWLLCSDGVDEATSPATDMVLGNQESNQRKEMADAPSLGSEKAQASTIQNHDRRIIVAGKGDDISPLKPVLPLSSPPSQCSAKASALEARVASFVVVHAQHTTPPRPRRPPPPILPHLPSHYDTIGERPQEDWTNNNNASTTQPEALPPPPPLSTTHDARCPEASKPLVASLGSSCNSPPPPPPLPPPDFHCHGDMDQPIMTKASWVDNFTNNNTHALQPGHQLPDNYDDVVASLDHCRIRVQDALQVLVDIEREQSILQTLLLAKANKATSCVSDVAEAMGKDNSPQPANAIQNQLQEALAELHARTEAIVEAQAMLQKEREWRQRVEMELDMTAMKLSQAQVELERYYKDMIAKRPEAEQEQEDSTSEVMNNKKKGHMRRHTTGGDPMYQSRKGELPQRSVMVIPDDENNSKRLPALEPTSILTPPPPSPPDLLPKEVADSFSALASPPSQLQPELVEKKGARDYAPPPPPPPFAQEQQQQDEVCQDMQPDELVADSCAVNDCRSFGNGETDREEELVASSVDVPHDEDHPEERELEEEEASIDGTSLLVDSEAFLLEKSDLWLPPAGDHEVDPHEVSDDLPAPILLSLPTSATAEDKPTDTDVDDGLRDEVEAFDDSSFHTLASGLLSRQGAFSSSLVESLPSIIEGSFLDEADSPETSPNDNHHHKDQDGPNDSSASLTGFHSISRDLVSSLSSRSHVSISPDPDSLPEPDVDCTTDDLAGGDTAKIPNALLPALPQEMPAVNGLEAQDVVAEGLLEVPYDYEESGSQDGRRPGEGNGGLDVLHAGKWEVVPGDKDDGGLGMEMEARPQEQVEIKEDYMDAQGQLHSQIPYDCVGSGAKEHRLQIEVLVVERYHSEDLISVYPHVEKLSVMIRDRQFTTEIGDEAAIQAQHKNGKPFIRMFDDFSLKWTDCCGSERPGLYTVSLKLVKQSPPEVQVEKVLATGKLSFIPDDVEASEYCVPLVSCTGDELAKVLLICSCVGS